jgi:hypothetical protein
MTVTNDNTGAVTFHLLQPIKHADNGNDDNTENNPDPYITVNVQIEDKDCDVAFTTVKVVIDDDMPVITKVESNFALSTDESLDGNVIPNNAGDDPHNPGFRIEDDEDGAGLPGALTGLGAVIGASKASGSGLFSFNAGADGLASAVYSLSLDGGGPVATSVKDTATNSTVNLIVNGNVIEGRSAVDNNLVFAFTINSVTGEVSMAQYRAVVHPTGNPDEEVILGTGGLKVNLAVTDKDGDTVTSSVDITGKIKIDDDGPHAVDDVDSVTEGPGHAATGNVVTGFDAALLGTDANGTDGNADNPGTDAPYTISKLAHDGHTYTLSADGLTVLKDGGGLGAGESYAGGKLTIVTGEGATLEIILTSPTQSQVGE